MSEFLFHVDTPVGISVDAQGGPARTGRMKNIAGFFDDEPVGLRAKTIGIYVVLLVVNALAWIWRWSNSGIIRSCSEPRRWPTPSGCAMASIPITSRRSTMSRAN